jgi:hypothetical protein
MGLASAGRTEELADRVSAGATGPVPVDIPRTRAADAVIGFPQSMQNRDAASFSRPQNVQVAGELTVGWGGTCGANIGGKCAVENGGSTV